MHWNLHKVQNKWYISPRIIFISYPYIFLLTLELIAGVVQNQKQDLWIRLKFVILQKTKLLIWQSKQFDNFLRKLIPIFLTCLTPLAMTVTCYIVIFSIDQLSNSCIKMLLLFWCWNVTVVVRDRKIKKVDRYGN